MKWFKDGDQLSNEITNSLTLEMHNLKESSKANYTCQASNEVGHFNIEFYLRVRNSNAYLWPISGIIAEIVCALFYIMVLSDLFKLINFVCSFFNFQIRSFFFQ